MKRFTASEKTRDPLELSSPFAGERTQVRGVSAFVVVFLFVFASAAQIQEAWVARYNNGQSNRFHQAVAMALDANGNIYVAGFSESSLGNSDYALIKYAPNGKQLWARCYGTAADERPNALVLDHFGNAIITGSGGTVKYTSPGAFLWNNGYAGNDVTVDGEDNVIVTGFSTNDFATAKFNPIGSNLWVRTYDGHGYPDVSQRVVTDSAGNVCIAGGSVWWLNRPPGIPSYYELLTVKYDPNGTRLWTSTFRDGPTSADVKGIAVDWQGDVYITGNLKFNFSYVTLKHDASTGTNIWSFSLGGWGGEVRDLGVGPFGTSLLTGEYGTVKVSSTGGTSWSARSGYIGNGVALGTNSNVHVTGTIGESGSDFATFAYDNNGQQLWCRTYNGSANGNDEGKAIAVDASGAVYVAGTSANTNGGADIVLIKYAELQTIQVLTNGHAFLQFFGTPGQDYRFQGSISLSNWVDLGLSTADLSGIYRFEDTNAPSYPHRFYRTASP